MVQASASVLTPAHQQLARWLVERERKVDVHQRSDAQVDPAELVVAKLSPQVAVLVTEAGYRALLSRALHLARAEFPLLDGVQVGTVGAYIDGPRAVGGAAGEDSVIALIGTLIGLLATFIGADLTDNLIRGAWPEAPLQRTTSDSGGTR